MADLLNPTREPTIAQHAKELLAASPDWHMMEWRVYGPAQDPMGVIVRGCEVPLITRGKRLGRPNWPKRDRATESDVAITYAAHDAWLAAWEAESGLCSTCRGTKEQFAGWGKETGVRYRPCVRCNATGLPPVPTTLAGEGGKDGK